MIQYVADRQALYMQAKQTRSDILYMTTLDTGRCSHRVSNDPTQRLRNASTKAFRGHLSTAARGWDRAENCRQTLNRRSAFVRAWADACVDHRISCRDTEKSVDIRCQFWTLPGPGYWRDLAAATSAQDCSLSAEAATWRPIALRSWSV